MDEMDDLYADLADWQSRRRVARVALLAWADDAPHERLRRAIADADAALAFIRARIDYLEEGRALLAAAEERADYWRSVL